MIVSKRKLNSWKLKFEHGDFTTMERNTGTKSRVLSRAFNSGRMATKTFLIIQEYYENKILQK